MDKYVAVRKQFVLQILISGLSQHSATSVLL